MPIDYKNYPHNWKTEIRPRILERAKNKCERCGVSNYATIIRNQENKSEYLILRDDGCYYTPQGLCIRLSEMPDGYWDSKDVCVVLTIAHIYDHDPMNCADDNLQALCQRCHLMLDAPLHAQRAARTRRRQYEARTGQMTMFDDYQ
jgi:hypothetical protein